VPRLDIKDVTKSYRVSRDGAIQAALGRINLSVEDGEFVSLVGPSGSRHRATPDNSW